jgi:hypothetical protein
MYETPSALGELQDLNFIPSGSEVPLLLWAYVPITTKWCIVLKKKEFPLRWIQSFLSTDILVIYFLSLNLLCFY